MNAYGAAAFRTCPFCLFAFKKHMHSCFFYERQIFNHAHVVFCSVALIKLFQSFAWEFVAVETKFAIQFRAVFYNASHTGRAFSFVGAYAAATLILCAEKSHAEAAVHAARRNEHFLTKRFHFLRFEI